MNIKNNLPLIFGISIPILMVIFVTASIYIPQMFVKPQYDFLYLIGNNNCYNEGRNSQVYAVVSNRLIKYTPDTIFQNCMIGQVPQLKIFVYSIAQNEGKEISFSDAQGLILDSSILSPDGFEIVNGGSNGGFFPFYFSSGSDYYTRYLQGHNISKKLNIQQGGNYYYNFTLLGWIKK